MKNEIKKILILGGGGFIGGHLAKRLKSEGHWVIVVDLKKHAYFNENEISDDFVVGDLRDPKFVESLFRLEYHNENYFKYKYFKQPFTQVTSLMRYTNWLQIWVVLVIFLQVKMMLM